MGNQQTTLNEIRKRAEDPPASLFENGGAVDMLREQLDQFREQQLVRLAKKSALKVNEKDSNQKHGGNIENKGKSKQMKSETYPSSLGCRYDQEFSIPIPHTVDGYLADQADTILLDGQPWEVSSPLGKFQYETKSHHSSCKRKGIRTMFSHMGWNLIVEDPQLIAGAEFPSLDAANSKKWDFYLMKPRIAGRYRKHHMVDAVEILIDWDLQIFFIFANYEGMIFCAEAGSEIPFLHGEPNFIASWKRLVDLRFIFAKGCHTMKEILMAESKPLYGSTEAES